MAYLCGFLDFLKKYFLFMKGIELTALKYAIMSVTKEMKRISQLGNVYKYKDFLKL